MQSIKAALFRAGWVSFPLPAELNVGIAYLSPSGDGQAERWAHQAHNGNLRANPKRFGGMVHNSGAGRAAIEFGLIGPQIAIVSGDVLQAAKLQLLCGRSEIMIACAANEVRGVSLEELKLPSLESETIAFSLVIEHTEKTADYLRRPLDGPKLELLEQVKSQEIQRDIDVFCKQWSLAKTYIDGTNELP